MRLSSLIEGPSVRGSCIFVYTHIDTLPDIERKDYRAWYGLGQAYELLNMHHYALYYLQKAASLK